MHRHRLLNIKAHICKKFGFGLGNQIQKYCPWVIQELKSEILKQVSDWVSANFFQDFINPNPKMKTRIFAGEDYWISYDWFIYFSVKYHWLIYSSILSFHWPKLNYTDIGELGRGWEKLVLCSSRQGQPRGILLLGGG